VSSTRRLSKAAGLSAADWGRLAEAAVTLAIVRLAVGRLPLRHVAGALRLRQGDDTPVAVQDDDLVGAVGLALQRAATRLPWQSTCLVQGIAAAAMLRRRRLDVTLHLGVAKDASSADGMAAHAWSRSGAVVLTGGGVADGFTVVGTYSARGRR
jgi:hypothetical protein